MQKTLISILASFCLIGASCPPIPVPPEPGPTLPPPPEVCLPEIPWCNDIGATCSSESQPCKHNPTDNPDHCELAPSCPIPEPIPEPTPEPGTCPYNFTGLSTGVKITVLRQKPNGVKILNTTGLVNDRVWCASHGFPNRNSCPPANEGLPERPLCELVIYGGECPRWTGNCTGTGSGQCPFTFDSDLAGNPWPANEVCSWPPDQSNPKVIITTPEGKGQVWVETKSGLSSNKIEVDQ